ncbi:MAG: thiamine diphosphokinase [Faecalibacterium sp.]|nr:thiamine diphosphokinase [Faecalibacterium sp.]
MENAQRKTCLLISAGSVDKKMKNRIAPEKEFIIACDAGWKNCAALGLRPNLIVGDFDSAPQPDDSPDTIILPHIKDDTDTQYAAEEAVRRGFTEVRMLGALGGARLEHTLANLGTGLWLEKHGVSVSIEDACSRITFVRPGVPRQYHRGGYLYLSVFPAEGRAEGVCIDGAFYPLQDAVLEASYPLGVSNEFIEKTVTIQAKTGFLAVIETISDL